jgi:pyruvate dehydrogenase (quinone)
VRISRKREHYARARKALDDLAAPGRGLIHPQQIAKAISDRAAEDAVFTCDVGLPTVWAARYLAMDGKRRLLGSFLARLDGQCDGPGDRRIGGIPRPPGGLAVGDGGFQMLMGDFSQPRPARAAGEGSRVQQRRALKS